jgi:hypothetical protein
MCQYANHMLYQQNLTNYEFYKKSKKLYLKIAIYFCPQSPLFELFELFDLNLSNNENLSIYQLIK